MNSSSLRSNKALLWGGFITYLVLSVISSVVVSFTDASLLMAQPVTNSYLFDVNFYKLIIFSDKFVLFGATIFAVYLDSNPGEHLWKEIKADIAFVASGWTIGGVIYAVIFCSRLRYLSQAQGGMILATIDAFTFQILTGGVYLFVFYHSVRMVIKMAKDKTNPEPAKK